MKLKFGLLSFSLFAYYAGDYSFIFGLLSMGIILFVRKVTKNILVGLFFILAIIFPKLSSLFEGPYLFFYNLKFFWGFFLFFIFFKYEANRLRYDRYIEASYKFFVVCLLLIALESVFLNVFKVYFANREHRHASELSGVYFVRAYGFGGNASVTSVLLLALSFFHWRNIIKDILMLVPIYSGTGFITLMLKHSLYFVRKGSGLLIVLGVLFAGYLLASSVTAEMGLLNKTSSSYLSYIIELKSLQVQTSLAALNEFEILLGVNYHNVELRTGDFQALDFFIYHGLIGTFIFLIIVISNINRNNVLPVIVILIGIIHYQVLFSMPGQVIFSAILAFPKSHARAKCK